VQIFCGPPVESGQQQGSNAFIPAGERPWTRQDIPCVGSMVPDGIVEIHINTDSPAPDEMALKSLVKNLRVHRDERLHELDKVIIRQFDGSTARALANRVGATLEYFESGGETNERVPRSMMPQWKREFEANVLA
jgi:hypothetical protein